MKVEFPTILKACARKYQISAEHSEGTENIIVLIMIFYWKSMSHEQRMFGLYCGGDV